MTRRACREYGVSMAITIPVRVPPEIDAWVRRRAAEEERTLSAIVRRVLRAEMDREKRKP